MTEMDQVVQLLTDNSTQDEAKLQTIKILKIVFNNLHKNFHKVNLESLIYDFSSARANKKCTTDLFYCYGNFIVNFLEMESPLKSKMLQQILSVLFELRIRNEGLLNHLVTNLWTKLETVKNIDLDFVKEIVPYSKKFLENVVLNWIEEVTPLKKNNYYIIMSGCSPELFQTIVSVLYQIVIKAQGNYRILGLMTFFVQSVQCFCEKKGINFICLFPWDCRNMVSLLLQLPKLHSVEDENKKLVTKEVIASLLSDLYFTNLKGTLMLVSIFPDWLSILNTYLGKTNY